MIEASCHCGNIKILVPDTTETVTSCNCSVCSRYASLWAYFAPAEVSITSTVGSVSSYRWGRETIEFHHCNNCGCLSHYTPTDLDEEGLMAVNFRMLDSKIVAALNVRYFDGADTWKEIEC